MLLYFAERFLIDSQVYLDVLKSVIGQNITFFPSTCVLQTSSQPDDKEMEEVLEDEQSQLS